MSRRERRLAENETLSRQINENVRRTAQAFATRGPDSVFEYVCECARPDCRVRIPLTLAEYEGVRRHPGRFAVARGHEDASIERVVDHGSAYVVVEKTGDAGAVAEQEPAG